MTSVFFGMKELLFISIYDGEKYYTDKFSMEEAKDFDNNKRSTLLSQGFDVETYEMLFYELKEKVLSRNRNAKNIWERAEIAEEYLQEKKDLAKEYLNVEWKS